MEIFLVEIDFSSIPSRDPEISFRFVKNILPVLMMYSLALEVLTFESRFAVEMRLKMHQEMIFLEVI